MPSRRNGESRRRWYNHICWVSSAHSSDSSESETYDHEPSPPVNIGADHPSPSPESLRPEIENVRQIFSLPPPPPPPPFLLDEPPRRLEQINLYATEIARVEDYNREGIRNMEITEAITREKTICPICKEEFKLGEIAERLPCDHFFCFDCIHDWINFNPNNTCPICRRPPLPAVSPPPPIIWTPEYFYPPSPPLPVADESESSPSLSMNNSEAGYDTAREELDSSHAHPQDSLASSTTTTTFPHSASGSTGS